MISALHDSPIGKLTLVSNGSALKGIYFERHKVGGPPQDAEPGEDAIITAARAQLDAYFAERRRGFDLALAPQGTPFQQRVWRELQAIGFGQTLTYAEIARRIGAPTAARAAGAAIGRNPCSIVIPCHRVLGASGALTGFAGGVERKRFLLDLEKHAARRAA